MKRRITVDVGSRRQGAAIERALTQGDIRAFTIMVGELQLLTSNRARARVLDYVWAYFNDPDTLLRLTADPPTHAPVESAPSPAPAPDESRP